MNKVINLAIIVPSSLPIPSVKGGAIETLVDMLIEKNEQYHQFNLTVYSQTNKEAKKKAKKLHNTKIVYINGEGLRARIFSFIRNWKNRRRESYFTSYFLTKACKKIRKSEVDAVVIEGAHGVSEAVKIQTRKTTILHLHNEFNPASPRAKEKAQQIDAYLTVSDYINRQACLVEGVDRSKVFTVHNCTNCERFNKELYQEEGRAIRRKYNIADTDVLVLFSGRITQEKGVLELAQAVMQLPQNIKLLIVGKPSFEDGKETEYSRQVNELALQGNGKIIVTGFVPYNEIPHYHAAVDIAVVPSVWDEPAALVVFEALSSGLPLILTRSGGMIEYCDESCAVIIPKDRDRLSERLSVEIRDLAGDMEKRVAMAKNSRAFIKKLDVDNYYHEYVDGIKNCLREIGDNE